MSTEPYQKSTETGVTSLLPWGKAESGFYFMWASATEPVKESESSDQGGNGQKAQMGLGQTILAATLPALTASRLLHLVPLVFTVL